MQQSPTAHGYKIGFWTIAILLTHLVQFLGLQLSPTTLRHRLHEADFRWRRPRLAPAKREDPETEAKLARIAQVKAEAKPEDHILIFGALDVRTGEWVSYFFDHRTRKEFIAFLGHLLTVYPTACIFIILDNGSIHKAKDVREWLAAHPRIQLLWLPTYRPHLNPVERIWKAMKKAIAANRAYAQLGLLKRAAREFFAGLTPTQALQTASLV